VRRGILVSLSSQRQSELVKRLQGVFRERKESKDSAFAEVVAARAAFKMPTEKNVNTVFDYIDTSGDGSISVAELTAAFRRANVCVGCFVPASTFDSRRFVRELDVPCIAVPSQRVCVAARVRCVRRDTELSKSPFLQLQLFSRIDADGSGSVSGPRACRCRCHCHTCGAVCAYRWIAMSLWARSSAVTTSSSWSGASHSHPVSCTVVYCRVVSCRVVSCRVVSCRVVSCRVVSCRVVSCRVEGVDADADVSMWLSGPQDGGCASKAAR
jgi:hypothetical protein